jgi:hypothetical protein
LSNGTNINRVCPGLPIFTSILEASHDLPHPGVVKIQNHGVIRSSSVATATLNLLEKSVLPLILDTTTHELMEKAKSDLRIIRISRSAKPEIVKLVWDAKQREATVTKSGPSDKRNRIEDSPIDCPEYLCFFSLTEHDGKVIDPSLRLYEGVVIHDGISERSPSIELLQSIRKRIPATFYRSLAFVFSVKRNQRILWAYNMNPQILKR